MEGAKPKAPQPSPALAAKVDSLLQTAVADEGARSSISMSALTIVAHLVPTEARDVGGRIVADAWTIASTGHGLKLGADYYKILHKDDGPTKVCDVYFPLHEWTVLPPSGAVTPTGHFGEILDHEAFHCVEAASIGAQAVSAFDDTASWVIEGGAAWAGAAEADFNDHDDWWAYWFLGSRTAKDEPHTTAGSLMDRSYSAIGFYSALWQAGISPWLEFASVYNAKGGATALDPADAFDGFVSGTHDLSDIWSPTYYRTPEWGGDWEPVGLGTGDAAPAVPTFPASTKTTTVPVKPYTAIERNLTVRDTSKVVEVVSDNPIRLRDKDGQLDRLEVTGIGLCFSPTACKTCPNGTDEPAPATAPVHIGATGMGDGLTYHVVAVDKSTFCKHPKLGSGGIATGRDRHNPVKPPSTGGGDDGTAPCLAGGCGFTLGDPHMGTVNGDRYDFQAVGEFDALVGGDGVHVQERLEAPAGDKTISYATAVAANVAGDRVGVYRTGNDLIVHVNGTALTSAPAGPLPHGGTVQFGIGTQVAAATGVVVTWPDTTRMWVWPYPLGLQVDVQLAPALIPTARGLFGQMPTSKLVARDGKTVVYSNPALSTTAYHDLYRTFGDSWRIDPSTSLFDYSGGERPADFDSNRSFPLETDLDVKPPDVAFAESTCANVTADDLRADCIFDVEVTGDPSSADSYLAVQSTLTAAASSTPTSTSTSGGGPTTTTGAGVLHPGDTVSGQTLAARSTANYQLAIDKTQTVYIQRGDNGPSGDIGGFSTWELLDPSGGSVTDSLAGFAEGPYIDQDIGRITLDPGRYTISFHTEEEAIHFGFTIVPVPPDQHFSIGFGDTVSPGHPAAGAGDIENWGARDVYSFTTTSEDQAVLLEFSDCGPAANIFVWEVDGPQGRLPGGDSSGEYRCGPDSRGELTIGDPGTYQIVFSALDAGEYAIAGDLPAGIPYDGRYTFTLARG